jgi:diguanylate cyclase (GGDEF)-like protein
VHLRQWALWRRPLRLIIWLLICEVATVTLIVLATVNSSNPSETDWLRFVTLGVCASAHLQLSRRQEEAMRSRKPTVHIDLVGIWSFAAVVVLPVHLAILSILLSRTQRWFVARRPVHRYLYSSCSMLLAAMATHGVVTAFGQPNLSGLTVWGSLVQLAVLMLGGLTYFSVQLTVIASAQFILDLRPTFAMLGTKDDNELEALTIALGTVAAILLVNLPAALAIIVVISVIGNRIAEVRQLQVDVRTDPKTGLLNMRGWREGAERALSRVERANGTAAVLMVDLDHFKAINDTWGHPAGDDMLEYVSHALRGATRPSDIVGRFGGEEFVVLLPEADVNEAEQAGERIRRMISELHVPTTDKRGGPVAITHRTTSIGVAVYPQHAKGLDELLQAADAAVYEAKENGRDQVRLAS